LAVPAGLGARGVALWEALTSANTFDAAGEVMVVEACRITDRLDRLDRLLRGEVGDWAQVVEPVAGGRLVLVLDSALTEARQQQGALRQVFASLGLAKAEAQGDGGLDAFLASLSAEVRDSPEP
jgi:hypothetical protein